MFGENSSTRLTDVADGTSNTLMMGERTLSTFNGANATGSWAYATRSRSVSTRSGQYNVTFPAQGLNVWNYNNNPASNVAGVRASWYIASSQHTGGVNFVYGDGSVHFISQTIDLPSLTYLSTMADGQTIPNPPQ